MQYSSSSENYKSSMRDSPSKWNNKEEKGGYSYKTSSYQYSSGGKNNPTYGSSSQNIDQLDALLDDLKNERQMTLSRDPLRSSLTTRSIEPENRSNQAEVVKTIRTTNYSSNNQQVPIESSYPHFDNVVSKTEYRTVQSGGYSPQENATTTIRREYNIKEKDYDYNKNVKVFENKSKLSEGNSTVEYTDVIPAANSTTVSQFEKDFKDITLTEDILPMPGTKVTTTVRTYTYEIPSDATHTLRNSTLNRSARSAVKYVDHQTSSLPAHSPTRPNVAQTVVYNTESYSNIDKPAHSPTRPNVPQTVVYNTESYSNINKHTGQPIVTNESYETREHRETTNTIRNNTLVPVNPRSPHGGPNYSPHSPDHPNHPNHTTKIIYNINRTENVHHMPNEPNGYPPRNAPLVSSPHSPPSGNGPIPGPTTHKYYYKESTNSVNTIHGPPGGPGGPGIPNRGGNTPNLTPNKYPNDGYPQYPQNNGGYPPHQGAPPTSTTIYKYSSTNTNTRHGGPDYGTPSPNGTIPFPVEYPTSNANPPQRVDELMHQLGTTDAVDRPVGDTTTIRKREIETAVASPNQPNIPTVNRAGKEVYYPPGHDMMIKREEMHAGSAAGGRWAKGSGMYEYESGYKSKSKTKTGGAMVPVCLPLCCAMPCSIM